MSKSHNNDGNGTLLPYDQWVEESLRTVIYRALEHVSRHGLPGDHHYYITFRTQHPEARVPGYLRAQHPDTMTIVLQHQFDDLRVGADGFDVTLRFGGKPETLTVPFASITTFHDPAVNFGLQLNVRGPSDAAGEEAPSGAQDRAQDREPERAAGSGVAVAAGQTPAKPEPQPKDETGKVVALDQFRKK